MIPKNNPNWSTCSNVVAGVLCFSLFLIACGHDREITQLEILIQDNNFTKVLEELNALPETSFEGKSKLFWLKAVCLEKVDPDFYSNPEYIAAIDALEKSGDPLGILRKIQMDSNYFSLRKTQDSVILKEDQRESLLDLVVTQSDLAAGALETLIADPSFEIDEGLIGRMQENAELTSVLARYYFNEGDFNKIVPLGSVLLKSGKAIDRFHLAASYEKTGQVPTAVEMYKDGFKVDCPLSTLRLAKLYESGVEGLEKNIFLANKFYQKAALLGHPAAQYIYGQRLIEGDGVTQNPLEGIRLLLAASENGIVTAHRDICKFFMDNRGEYKLYQGENGELTENWTFDIIAMVKHGQIALLKTGCVESGEMVAQGYAWAARAFGTGEDSQMAHYRKHLNVTSEISSYRKRGAIVDYVLNMRGLSGSRRARFKNMKIGNANVSSEAFSNQLRRATASLGNTMKSLTKNMTTDEFLTIAAAAYLAGEFAKASDSSDRASLHRSAYGTPHRSQWEANHFTSNMDAIIIGTDFLR